MHMRIIILDFASFLQHPFNLRRMRIIGCYVLGYVRVTYSIGERAKQLVKVICTYFDLLD